VQQTAEQARLEGVALSELEKRMMYFTESGYVPEDPITLNDEFEAQYDTQEYEQKLAALLDHAYKRVRGESEAKAQNLGCRDRCSACGGPLPACSVGSWVILQPGPSGQLV